MHLKEVKISGLVSCFGALFLSACSPQSDKNKVQLAWPCGVNDLELSPSGDSLVLTRQTKLPSFSEWNWLRTFGFKIKLMSPQRVEMWQISLNDKNDKWKLLDRRFENSQIIWRHDKLKYYSNKQLFDISLDEYRGFDFGKKIRICNYSYNFLLLSMDTNAFPLCVIAGSNFAVPTSSGRLHYDESGWKPNNIDKLINPLIIFNSNGNIVMVIERTLLGATTNIYLKFNQKIHLPNADELSIVEPTELDDGSVGFWTDTPLEGERSQFVLYRVNERGLPKKVEEYDDFWGYATLARSAGRNLMRARPVSKFLLGPEIGVRDGSARQIIGRRSLIIAAGITQAWVETTSNGSESIFVQRGADNPRVLAKCPGSSLLREYIVSLNSSVFGKYRAFLDNYSDNPNAPLAIIYHGGPAGSLSERQTAEDSPTMASTTALMMRMRGFQTLAVDYPGSGIFGISFRQKLKDHAAQVAADVATTTTKWARAASKNSEYMPAIAGTSYGAYLASVNLTAGVPAAGYVLASGVYNPSEDFNGIAPSEMNAQFAQGGTFYAPYDQLGLHTFSNIPVIITYAKDDEQVVPDDSKNFSKKITYYDKLTTVIRYSNGGHEFPTFYLATDKRADAIFQIMKKRAGPFYFTNYALKVR